MIGTPEKPCFVLAPEAPDPEIAGDRSDIGQAVFLKTDPKELFRPPDFHRAGVGLDEVKAGTASSRNGRTGEAE
jgi:hypothetical protein